MAEEHNIDSISAENTGDQQEYVVKFEALRACLQESQVIMQSVSAPIDSQIGDRRLDAVVDFVEKQNELNTRMYEFLIEIDNLFTQ